MDTDDERSYGFPVDTPCGSAGWQAFYYPAGVGCPRRVGAMSRAAVFIDGGYLTHLPRPFGEPTIAFDRLAAELTLQVPGTSILGFRFGAMPGTTPYILV